MIDFTQSVVLPREDYMELQSQAFSNSQTPATMGERLGNMVTTFVFCAIVATAVTAGGWGWAKAQDWREEKAFQRKLRDS